ncbi:MAG TPA: OsmC family protein [Streptosporangiales bacterium]
MSTEPGAAGSAGDGVEKWPESGARYVVVSESGTGPYGQRISAGGHELTADEPEPIGNDTGPGPYELLLASLGACTSMTVRMYARRKGWPLTKVTVWLRHSRIYAADCADCETEEGRIDRIERVIELDGGLDHEQRRRLLEIADKCPVHRTLRTEISVVTSEHVVADGVQRTVGAPEQ